MDHYCKSVNSKSGKLLYKISAIFEGDALDLTIFQNETAWNVYVSKQELLGKSINQLKFHDYYDNLKKYVECYPKDVEFDFKPDDFNINVVLKNKMKMSYFHIQLKQVKFVDSIFSLVDRLDKEKIEYFNELRVAKSRHDSVKKAYDSMEKKMNEFIDRRKTEEQNTYNNFIAILNEKQRQIQHLNDLLVAFRQGRPTINPSVQVKRNKKPLRSIKTLKTTHKTTSESESNDESDNDHYNTDDSDSSDSSKSVKKTDYNVPRVSNNLSPVPGTSKRQEDNSYKSSSDSLTQLPKRLRRENILKQNCILPKKEIEEIQEDKKAPRENSKISEKVPTVNFNTQDLLDNL